MVGGMAVGAAVRTFPFRVYSFPSDIKIASPLEFPAWMYDSKYFTLDLPVPYEKTEANFAERNRIADEIVACTRMEYGPPLVEMTAQGISRWD